MTMNSGQRASRLYWIPFFAGLASACLYVYSMAARAQEIRDLGLWITMILGVVVGLLAVAQSVLAAANVGRLSQQRQTLQEQLNQAYARNEQLVSRVEVFTAMREIVQVLSDAVDFKPIATRVLDILAPLLGSDEIALILTNEEGKLVVRALRRNGRTVCPDQPLGDEVELTTAGHALEQGTLVKAVLGSKRVFCVPLFADHTAIGVLRFEIPTEGPDGQTERQVSELEATLLDIARHMALVVKTPRLYDRAIIDSVTGLFTRRHFDSSVEDQFRLARRYGAPYAMILIDIDRFKQVNDTYGHPVGDAVLREIAGVITGTIRGCDSAFRYGGDEFAVLLPETSAAHAALLADRLRKTMNAYPFKANQVPIRITVSQGIAEYSPKLTEAKDMVTLADAAMYKAKKSGRDCVSIASETP